MDRRDKRKGRRLLHWNLRKKSEGDGEFQDGDYDGEEIILAEPEEEEE